MAYICGLTTKAERDELRRRGWELEACPAELIPTPDNPTLTYDPRSEHPEDYIMIWVDSSVLDVMSGPDWGR
jgi:hypothetical protein